ncbi:hypothetical protein DLAC_05989 [Tieghemostelium lacteum]|uniref:Uncharacterized protein n=1 Tax=Tieghemostelium lacteum TaxID=361077 RepID=A0A151ZH63_TIELA|nr:hypothetical protein DLAC_05989 [Tieghemostelium lacteum]|eukprot:KYQ93321.1 hypothetical protein DLAC_05989 [Tieghemostelium lacteum]
MPVNPPKSCDYVDFKDYLVISRKHNDNFIYELNKMKSTSECDKVWETLESKSLFRISLINNCIDETQNKIDTQQTNTDSIYLENQRKLKNKLNFLIMERDVESILTDNAKKVFHKFCK